MPTTATASVTVDVIAYTLEQAATVIENMDFTDRRTVGDVDYRIEVHHETGYRRVRRESGVPADYGQWNDYPLIIFEGYPPAELAIGWPDKAGGWVRIGGNLANCPRLELLTLDESRSLTVLSIDDLSVGDDPYLRRMYGDQFRRKVFSALFDHVKRLNIDEAYKALNLRR